MKTLQDQLDEIRQGTAIAEHFCATFSADIPDGLGFIYTSFKEVKFIVTLTYRPESERVRALQAMGDIFGRDGWQSNPDAHARAFTWNKTLESGIQLTITGAETMPDMQPMPVPPAKFPIQLTDAK